MPKGHVLLVALYGDGDDPGIRLQAIRFRTQETAYKAQEYLDRFAQQLAGFIVLED